LADYYARTSCQLAGQEEEWPGLGLNCWAKPKWMKCKAEYE
jgi:hypothetical protein